MGDFKSVKTFGKREDDYFQLAPSIPSVSEMGETGLSQNPFISGDNFNLVITNMPLAKLNEELDVGEYRIMIKRDGGVFKLADSFDLKEEEYFDETLFLKRLLSALSTASPNSYCKNIDTDEVIPISILIDIVREKSQEMGSIIPPTPSEPTPKPKPTHEPELKNRPKPEPRHKDQPSQKSGSAAPIILALVLVAVVGGAIFLVVKSRMGKKEDEL